MKLNFKVNKDNFNEQKYMKFVQFILLPEK